MQQPIRLLLDNVISNAVRNLASTKYKLKKIIPALLWSGIIFFLCFLPGSALPKEDWLDKIHFDKIVHAGLYCALFLLIIRIFENRTTAAFAMASILCIVQGILIEFIQGSTFIEHRSFDVFDILANIAGIILANLLKWYKYFPINTTKN